MIVLNFCQSLIDTGKGQYIIKSEVVSDGLVNTAWTLGLVLNGAVIVFIVASFRVDCGVFFECLKPTR